jgi:serine/threonine-protein kinase
MTEHIGRVLGGRYRLLSPLGSGASADVYLGDDVRLHRRVAIKMLHPSLAHDDAFLRRFRAEARAAAALSHPNILAVYDWDGEDPPYLITEYLKGGSLRAMLDAGHRLSPSQALVIGLQAAQGLDVAHRQGFVHRDMKPANLLFGGDGRLRVADFGLARAVAEAAMTEPTGAVLGTARYASPEQAQGENLTGQSDLYALGLVMIEAVTGKVPFAADTTVGTLMARLDRAVEVPEDMAALRPVVERLGAVSPSDRPDAAELVSELMDAATELPRPATLPLVGQSSLRQDVAPDTEDKTIVAGALAAPALGSPATVQQPALGAAPVAPVASTQMHVGTQSPAPAAAGPGGPGGPHPADPSRVPPGGAPKRSVKRRRVPGWFVPTLLTVLALLVGAGGAWFLREASVPSHTIPDELIGAEYEDLDDLIGDRGWRRDVTWEYSDDMEVDHISRTAPGPGAELKEGEKLEVVVSCGPLPVALPAGLEGTAGDDAEDQLIDQGFEVEVERDFNDDVDRGDVVEVAAETGATDERCASDEEVPEAGAPPGSTVVLHVSDGPEPTVPEVVGMPWDRAKDVLEEAGFEPQREGERNRDVRSGRVIRTDPAAGSTLEEGSEITVYVSQGGRGDDDDDDDDDNDGGESVQVPVLFGKTVEDAENTLESIGLELGNVDGSGDSFVRDQDPAAFQTVEEGTKVNIFMW